MQFDVIREVLNITKVTKSDHFHGVKLASLYQLGYLICGVIALDQWRHVLASLFTIHQLHVYAFIQSALPDDVTCMASLCGVILYPACISLWRHLFRVWVVRFVPTHRLQPTACHSPLAPTGSL